MSHHFAYPTQTVISHSNTPRLAAGKLLIGFRLGVISNINNYMHGCHFVRGRDSHYTVVHVCSRMQPTGNCRLILRDVWGTEDPTLSLYLLYFRIIFLYNTQTRPFKVIVRGKGLSHLRGFEIILKWNSPINQIAFAVKLERGGYTRRKTFMTWLKFTSKKYETNTEYTELVTNQTELVRIRVPIYPGGGGGTSILKVSGTCRW